MLYILIRIQIKIFIDPKRDITADMKLFLRAVHCRSVHAVSA